jgi:hypothetical protein
MTIDEVKARVQRIRDTAGDPESQHAQEDILYTDFIQWVAKHGNTFSTRLMAREILKTRRMGFPRWYA